MNVYDTTTMDAVEPGDLIVVQNDPIEVHSTVDSGEAILVKGYSHMTGDTVTYIRPADEVVELWMG